MIDDRLANIKVCDPAVGSGAFPLGMMSEIVKARNVLSKFIGEESIRTTYNFKRDCIQNSLYGVDIDPGACEIAKLRFWLSLVVDEEDIKQIKPLPNLDYKIICGNSLLGVEKNLFNAQLFGELEKLKPLLFNETNPTKKQEYKKQIDRLISEITNGHMEFDFEVYFSEVFHEKKGFDVVIANPPFVRQEKIKNLKPLLQQQEYEVYNSTSDLYTYFYEKSYNILKNNGHLCFISSNKWMRAKYGEKLRKFFKQRTLLKQIIDFAGHQVFDATVDTHILLFQKEISQLNHILNVVNVEPDFTKDTNLDIYSKTHNLSIAQKDLDSNCFTFGDESIMNLKAKIEKIGIPLKDWNVKIYRGVTTGFNEAFIIDNETKEKFGREDPKNTEIIKPILRGRDIGRYYYEWKELWIITTFPSLRLDINKYPAVRDYLKKFEKRLEQTGEPGCRKKTDHEWFETQDTTAYYPEFEKEKIVWREIVEHSCFTWDSKNYFGLAKVFIMTGKENNKFLLTVLNSKLGDFAIKKYYSPFLGTKASEFKKEWVQKMPIPQIPKNQQQPFINLVDQILAITKDDDYLDNSEKQAKVKEYERLIDELVYKLYGLTDKEIKIVEGIK